MGSVPWVVSLSTENDETTALADQHLPVSHFLESWGDSFPRRGVYSLQQPVMAKVPQFNTLDLGDLLLQTAALSGNSPFTEKNHQQYLMAAWLEVHKLAGSSEPFEQFWRKSQQLGGFFSDFQAKTVSLQGAVFSAKPELSNRADNSYGLLA